MWLRPLALGKGKASPTPCLKSNVNGTEVNRELSGGVSGLASCCSLVAGWVGRSQKRQRMSGATSRPLSIFPDVLRHGLFL